MSKKAVKPTRSVYAVEFDREDDGRWIAAIPSLPGVMAYGTSKNDALRRVSAIALRTLADKIEHGQAPTRVGDLFRYEVASR